MRGTDEMTQYLTVEDVALMLSVHKSWVYERVKRGTIPHLKIGTLVRFRPEDVDKWLAGYSV
jgi:excisionase family DNA binding protein